jgi:hypothetical protein
MKSSSLRTVRGLAVAVLAGLMLVGCDRSDHRGREPAELDAGTPDAAPPRERIVATANVRLQPTAPARAEDPLNGTVAFRTTSGGVDLEAYVSGCNGGGPFAVAILDATDCEADSLEAQAWARGDEIPPINCVGPTGPGRLYYAHPDERERWTIGGAAKSNLIGRALVVREPSSGTAVACGVIERGEDVAAVPLPPDDRPPSIEVRAQISGLCFAKQFSAASVGDCADSEALVACAADHCELGACLETCAEQVECIDGSEDVCAAMFTCPITDACSQCENAIWLCASGYCPQLFGCVPPITRDGPCGQLEACCALQGEGAAACLQNFRLAGSLGGDATCIGAMQDWDLLSHLHVPCKFKD